MQHYMKLKMSYIRHTEEKILLKNCHNLKYAVTMTKRYI